MPDIYTYVIIKSIMYEVVFFRDFGFHIKLNKK